MSVVNSHAVVTEQSGKSGIVCVESWEIPLGPSSGVCAGLKAALVRSGKRAGLVWKNGPLQKSQLLKLHQATDVTTVRSS